MLLAHEYKSELEEHISTEPDETFTNAGTSRAAILADKDNIERAWVSYQKAVQEYNVPAYQAFREAMSDVFNIPEPEKYD